jgi:hypothetical protein
MEEESFKDFLTGSARSFQEGINAFVREISLRYLLYYPALKRKNITC